MKKYHHLGVDYRKGDLLVDGKKVMMEWERPYMEMAAKQVTTRGGRLLEIGLGLGLFSEFAQKSRLTEHIIIEPHPKVIDYNRKKFSDELKSGKIRLLEGYWADIVRDLPPASFDGIFFDTIHDIELRMPLAGRFLNSTDNFLMKLGTRSDVTKKMLRLDKPVYPFVKEAYRLLKKDGVFSYFSHSEKLSNYEVDMLKKAGFTYIKSMRCNLRMPKKLGRKPWMVLPIAKKIA